MPWIDILNRLLPFATKGTPLVQDLIHLAAICVLLYFAPQLQERFQGTPTTDSSTAADAGAEEGRDHELANAPEPHGAGDHAALPAGLRDHAENDDHDHDENGARAADQAPPRNNPVANEPDLVRDAGAPNAAAPALSTAARNVGAKKAKSLARRDQRRAYNEFMRNQGEAQRAADAEGALEREAAQQAERARRKAAEAVLEAKKTQERAQRRARETQAREEEHARRDLAVECVREALRQGRRCHVFDVVKQVGGDVDEEWVEKILGAAGVLGAGVGEDGEGRFSFITSTGYVVRVTRREMEEVYARIVKEDVTDEQGLVAFEEVGRLLEETLYGS